MSSAETSGTSVTVTVNGVPTTVDADPDTPLLARAARRARPGGARGSAAGWAVRRLLRADRRRGVPRPATPRCGRPRAGRSPPSRGWPTATAAPGAAGVPRRAGRPVRFCVSGIAGARRRAAGRAAAAGRGDGRRRRSTGNLCRCGVQRRIVAAGRCRAGRADAVTAERPAALPRTSPPTRGCRPWVAVDDDGTVHVRVGKVELGQGILTALPSSPPTSSTSPADRVRMLRRAPPPAAPTRARPPAACRSPTPAPRCARRVPMSGRCSSLLRRVARRRGRRHRPWRRRLRPRTATAGVLRRAGGRRRPRRGRRRVGPGRKPGESSADRHIAAPARPARQGRSAAPGSSRTWCCPASCTAGWCGRRRPARDLTAVDRRPSRRCPACVAVVRDGSFLGVVGDRRARGGPGGRGAAAAAAWEEHATLPDEDDLAGYLRDGPVTTSTSTVLRRRRGRTPQARKLSASYSRPFLAHASIVAELRRWRGGTDGTGVHVWSHSQGIHGLRDAIAVGARPRRRTRWRSSTSRTPAATGTTPPTTRPSTRCCWPGRCPGRPVLVRWSRPDELTWVAVRLGDGGRRRRGLVAEGRIVGWALRRLEPGPHRRGRASPAPRGCWPARTWPTAARRSRAPVDPPPAARRRQHPQRRARLRPCRPRRIRGHRRQDVALRTSSMRALGAYLNVFAIESFMDELADCAGADPLEFRLGHLDRRPRAARCCEAAADRAGWASTDRAARTSAAGSATRATRTTAPTAPSSPRSRRCSDVRVRRLTLAVDVGRVVNPDGVRNQIEGGAVQATSWTLKERVRFDRTPDHQRRLGDLPDPALQRDARRSTSTCSTGPTCRRSAPARRPRARRPAAIAQRASHAALGVRVRDLPLTPDASSPPSSA